MSDRAIHVPYTGSGSSIVHWEIEIFDYRDGLPLDDLLIRLADAKERLVADGVEPDSILVEIETETDYNYGDTYAQAKVLMKGKRPATKDEIAVERHNRDQQQRQSRNLAIAQARANLARLEAGQ